MSTKFCRRLDQLGSIPRMLLKMRLIERMTNLTGETGGLIMCFLWKKSVATSQEDCANSEVSPPKDLLKVYGVKAQMLGPLIWDHKLVGFISVHYTPSTRHWSHNDIAALDNAKERVMSRLKQAEWLI